MSLDRSPRRLARTTGVLWAVAAWLALSLVAIVHASEPVRVGAVKFGFEGYLKIGHWAPVSVEVLAGDEPFQGYLEIIAIDGDGLPSCVRVPENAALHVDPGQAHVVSTYIKIGQPASDVRINLCQGATTVATRDVRVDDPAAMRVLPSHQELILQLGSPPIEADLRQWTQRHVQIVNVRNLDALPRDWWGFDAVDTVFILTSEPEIARELATPTPQSAAIAQWLHLGGRLLMSVGRSAATVLGPQAPLSELAPGRFEETVPLTQGSAIETYAESSETLEEAGRLRLEVPKLNEVQGKIEAFFGSRARDLPLVVRAASGFGEVVFIALDLDQPPLAEWRGKPQLLDHLLQRARYTKGNDAADGMGQVTTLGFVDLAGQLRGALDQFNGVTIAPFWLIALLIVAYLVCIGPLDYLLVKRVLRRMEATWLTFTIWVLLFGGVAYALAHQLKGRELRTNQVDLVDVDVSSNLVRGTSWVNLFSPTSAAYDLALKPAATVGPAAADDTLLLSWSGLPGSGFGGIDPAKVSGIERPRGSFSMLSAPYYFVHDFAELADVPFATWSSKAFIGRWSRAATPNGIVATFRDAGKLTGQIESHLDFTLENAVLIYGRWAYLLGSFKPGRQIDIETEIDPQTVDTYLRQVKLRGDSTVALPYDRTGFDVARIMEVMTAHELAGGENYTRLANRYQAYVDLSELVQLGRAILVGRSERRAAEFTVDGQAVDDPGGIHHAYYRFVLPVASGVSNR